MAFPYVIEHVDGGRWLTQHGWAEDMRVAMQFPSEGDGRAYLGSAFPGTRHNIVRRQVDDDGPLRAAAATEYDPWGFNRT